MKAIIDHKKYGRLVFISKNGKSETLAEGPWPLMQHKKSTLSRDIFYKQGKLKIKHI